MHRYAVLRAARPRQARLNGAQVELHHAREPWVGGVVRTEEPLLLRVPLNQLHKLLRPAGHAQVAERLVVHGEHGGGRAVFRGHIGDGGAVRQRESREAGAIELHELVHHAPRAQHLCDGKHEVGRGRSLGQRAGELEPYHPGSEQVQWLA